MSRNILVYVEYMDLVSLILELLEFLEILKFLEFLGFWGLCQENLGILVICPFWEAEDSENLDVVRPRLESLESGIYTIYTNC